MSFRALGLLVTVPEVDTAVPARHARLIGRVAQRLPRQDHVLRWGDARLDLQAARLDGHPGAEVLVAVEGSQDGAAGGAERAVPDTYSGNAGVTTLSAWYGIQFLAEDLPQPFLGPSQEVTSLSL